MAGQNLDRAGGAGGGPINIALGEIVCVVEGAGVAVIVRLANPGVEFDLLAVAQIRQRFAFARVKRDLSARFGVEFEQEALARAGDRGRFHHAATQNDDFARFGIDFGRRPGLVGGRGPDPGEEKAEAGTRGSENARAAQGGDGGQDEKCGGDDGWFSCRKRNKPRGENAGGEGDAGGKQRVGHVDARARGRRSALIRVHRRLNR